MSICFGNILKFIFQTYNIVHSFVYYFKLSIILVQKTPPNDELRIQRGFNINYFYEVFEKGQSLTRFAGAPFAQRSLFELPAHFLHNKCLESVALADIVELFDTDTALYSLPQVGEGGPQLLATVVDEDATSA